MKIIIPRYAIVTALLTVAVMLTAAIYFETRPPQILTETIY